MSIALSLFVHLSRSCPPQPFLMLSAFRDRTLLSSSLPARIQGAHASVKCYLHPLLAIDVILLYDDKDHMGYAVLSRSPEHW